MTKVRRLLALGAFLALVAVLSAPSRGQIKTGGGTTAQRPAPAAPAAPIGESIAARFTQPGVLTYQPVQGDAVFALQLQPKLPPAQAKPRDFLIMVSTAATMASPNWTGALQIADGIVQTAGDNDRVSVWVLNDKDATKCVTGDFLKPKFGPDEKKLQAMLATVRNKNYPSGAADFKSGLAEAMKTFENGDGRQRIFLFLGDGQSTLNPISADERLALAREMVARKIAFFPVPLGTQLDPANLHGLASATGGTVLRTRLDEEKLPDTLKRYHEAFAAGILYNAKLDLPADVTEVYPATLPPVRGDAPTLVVGRTRALGKGLPFTLTGTQGGRNVTVEAIEPFRAPDLDNYFLLGMAEQWQKAKTMPALLRADRALTFAYEQTKLQHQELLLGAQMALERNELAAAGRLFDRIRQLAPHDAEAEAGNRVLDKLTKGTLTLEMLKQQKEKALRNVEKISTVNGKTTFARPDKVWIAQVEKDMKGAAEVVPPPGGAATPAEENLLQAHRDRILIEEQRMTQMVDDAVRQARRDLQTDPDLALDGLRNSLNRVKDHPDLGERVRDGLTARLQTAMRDVAGQARAIKLRKQTQEAAAATARSESEKDAERRTFEERVEAQFRVFRNLMNQARFEESTKQAVIYGLFGIANEARVKGQVVPPVVTAAYDITLASYHIQKNLELRRLREERFLATMLEVEKSHVPFPDEPPIYFPPLPMWKAIRDLRKEQYEVSSLPDDPEARKEANQIYKLLQEPIETKDFINPMSLKDALGLMYEKFAARKMELPILIDTNAFKESSPDAVDPYDAQVKLPSVPRQLTTATALRLLLSQIPTNDATYLIRRNFIEVTTNDRMVKDKVLRVYPVGDLVIPISQAGGQQTIGAGQQQGGFGGQIQGGFGGQIQGGFGGGFGGQIQGGFGGGFGQIQGGFGGQFGGGFGGQFGGGFGGQFGGQFGGGFQAGFGGLGGLGGIGGIGGIAGLGGLGGLGGVGGIAGGGGFAGGFQGVPGSFQGGSFQGGFNGSLGALGATQAVGLIDLITRVVAPGEWFKVTQPQPLAPMVFAGLGFIGMGGGMNMNGLVGGGAQPAPMAETGTNPDIQTANTIDFFPPALALIVRGPARVHTSVTGGIIGGKSTKKDPLAAGLGGDRPGLVAVGPRVRENPEVKIAGAANAGAGADVVKMAKNIKKSPDLDPAKVWNEAFAKEPIQPGLVIATADLLFQAGQFDPINFRHAAEFLKANLRAGSVVRPWVYESLAVALEASGASADEVRRARLSAVALDPKDARGFLTAARALADQKQWDRALAFCRQAAQLEPNLAHPYQDALAYAELSKDGKAMEWAAGKLLAQDWPSDSGDLHSAARLRADALATTLSKEQRGADADRIRAALKLLTRRDLVVKLSWDNGSDLAELEMQVKEPCGSIGSTDQKQTPGGGTLATAGLTDKQPSTVYTAAEAFTGTYEVTVRRVYGQPLGGRARLEVVQHVGTPKETRRIEVVDLARGGTFKVTLRDGRRTDLAAIPPATPRRVEPKAERLSAGLVKLREAAHPDYTGVVGPRGSAGTPGASIPAAPAPASTKAASVAQSPVVAAGGSGVHITAQVRLDAVRNAPTLVVNPIFQAVGNGPAGNLSAIPGGQ